MSHGFYELYNLMPKLDCGLCGNPSCQTMTRKIATGDAKPEECINLSARPEFRENLQKIGRLLLEGVEIAAKGRVVIEGTGITYVHPCITDAGKVAADIKLTASQEGLLNLKYGFYDPLQLCAILSTIEFFQDVKCSQSLGIGRGNVSGKAVLIYKDGRISVRKARDKEDAVHTIRQVSRSLWGAIICTCGNASVDCASGGCKQCLLQGCPVIDGGPPDPTTTDLGLTEQTITSSIFEKVKTLKTRQCFEECIPLLDEAFSLFVQANLKLLKKQPVNGSALTLIEKKIAQVNRLAITFIVETPKVHDAAIGLIISGVAMDLTRITDGLKTLALSKDHLTSSLLTHLISEAVSIVTEAYNSFKTVDFKRARQIATRYAEFKKKWTQAFKNQPQKDVLIAIQKIAVNGFYMSRLVSKPLSM